MMNPSEKVNQAGKEAAKDMGGYSKDTIRGGVVCDHEGGPETVPGGQLSTGSKPPYGSVGGGLLA